jgi:C4-dicarboxylate-specific signal transduction histidine kinase/ABC-type uncharacterized transport system substrate-binding protein
MRSTTISRSTAFAVAALIECAALGGVLHAGSVPQASEPPKRVLMVYSVAAEQPGIADFIRHFRGTLRGGLPTPIEFYEEFLDATRGPGLDRPALLTRILREKYGDLEFDLIVPVGAAALRLATEYLTPLFPNIPVVFALTVGQRAGLPALPSNVTGRTTGAPFVPTLDLARSLQPDARHVVVVGGSSGSDSAIVASVLRAIAPFRDSLAVSVLQGQALPDLLLVMRRLSKETIVVFANFERDGRGQPFIAAEAAEQIAAASGAPVYAHVATGLGRGIVGGAVAHYDVEGTKTGELALRVLRRSPGVAMPPVEVPDHTLEADWRQLRRWHLSERRLPAGTLVHFRPSPAWERYRIGMFVTIALIVLQALLIARLLIEHRRRLHAQQIVEDQLAFERMISDLTVLLVEHGATDMSSALGFALARLGSYSGATGARLTCDVAGSGPRVLTWPMDGDGKGSRTSGAYRISNPSPSPRPAGVPLALPLLTMGNRIGTVELHPPRGLERWPDRVVPRLRSAIEVIASAIARRTADVAAEESRRQVAHMARVASVGELAATLIHELGQPLTAIANSAHVGGHLLAGESPDLDDVRTIFLEIAEDDARAAAVIERVRTLLQKEEPRMEAVDLNTVCREVDALLRHDTVMRRARLDLRLSQSLPLVQGDPVQLKQVVINLVLNALEAASSVDGRREVTLRTEPRDGLAELSVHDSGSGLTADTAARLFQPLFSTKAQGLGMGLTIVRSIVERHGGRIRAENHAMGGALFRVTLPRALGAEPRVQPSRPRLSLTDVELPLSGIAGTA